MNMEVQTEPLELSLPASSEPMHAFSFDVEEFFQVANFDGIFPRAEWDSVPSRLMIGMERLLDCLERNDTHATFFFLGWVAERFPELVKRCLDGGHEVQSHGYEHKFLFDLDPESFDRDLELTEEALMAAGAPRPTGFRASTFTITERTYWAFDVLVKRGYVYDSSVHPVRHPTYGVPDFEPSISRVTAPGGGQIIEFPVATYPLFKRNLPVGGGGYFRLWPGWVTAKAIAGLEKQGRSAAFYLHPWEFDPEQPRQEVAAFKRFRHYLNLDRTLVRLDGLLRRFRFGTMGEVLRARGLDVEGAAGR